MRLQIFALLGLATTACLGPTVQSFKLRASVGGSERVDAFQIWPSIGETLNAGVRNLDPSSSELRTWEEKAGWLTYTPARSCFGILTHQLTVYESVTGSQDNPNGVVDFERVKYTLVTASGQTLTSEPPTVDKKPLRLRYEGWDQSAGRYIPAAEQWVRNKVEVCFRTPKPLAEEQWVKWTYGAKDFRNELLFTIDGDGAGKPVVTETKSVDEFKLKVDASVMGTVRKKKVYKDHQPGAIAMRFPPGGGRQVEATLTLPPHLSSCVFKGTIGNESLSVPPQACSDAPEVRVSGKGTMTSKSSMQLTVQVDGPDVMLNLEMALTE